MFSVSEQVVSPTTQVSTLYIRVLIVGTRQKVGALYPPGWENGNFYRTSVYTREGYAVSETCVLQGWLKEIGRFNSEKKNKVSCEDFPQIIKGLLTERKQIWPRIL